MTKGVLIFALILLVLLTGLPLAMGMAPMPPCPECHLTPGGAFAMCLAFLGLLALVVPMAASRFTVGRLRLHALLLSARPERPPR